MASKKTIEIVKSTVPVLEKHGTTITSVFYRRLFENHPELKDMFNMTNQKKGKQPHALASAVFKYASYIDKLEMMTGAVETIAHKHTSLSITPEMYPIVGKNLLDAIKEVLGNAATPEIMDAWAEAYEDLAVILIKKEESLYSNREEKEGGFRGKKEFVVVKKTKENELITSFYLKRKDGSPIPPFAAGQYISLMVNIPNSSHQHTRNYSLSDFGKDYLRISVKKEMDFPEGIVSNHLHQNIHEGDILPISMPSGEFVLQESTKPLVLIAGGIGITPLLSMYKQSLKENPNREIVFIQCALNSITHAFKNEILEEATENVKSLIIYSDPLEITPDVIKQLHISVDSDFYFCGPTPFMAHVSTTLQEIGVVDKHINYEFFGPAEALNTLVLE